MKLCRRNKVKPTGIVWDMDAHNGWGNRISWFDWSSLRLSGHTTPRPSVGDEMRCKLQSGRVGRFLLVEVETMRDPPDMWFGTVAEIGYLDDDPDAPPVTRRSVFGAALEKP